MTTRTVRSRWSGTVLVCRKRSKKLGGGFGPEGKRPLAKALRKHLALGKGPKAEAGSSRSHASMSAPSAPSRLSIPATPTSG